VRVQSSTGSWLCSQHCVVIMGAVTPRQLPEASAQGRAAVPAGRGTRRWRACAASCSSTRARPRRLHAAHLSRRLPRLLLSSRRSGAGAPQHQRAAGGHARPAAARPGEHGVLPAARAARALPARAAGGGGRAPAGPRPCARARRSCAGLMRAWRSCRQCSIAVYRPPWRVRGVAEQYFPDGV